MNHDRNEHDTSPRPGDWTRREFVKTSTAALSVGALAAPAFSARRKDDPIHVGLIGCGGRGTGAAGEALKADPGVILYAMGDVFADRLEQSLNSLKGRDTGDRVHVPAERQFIGFDAYQQVIDSGVDVVLLATPPHFRPMHLEAAVDAGKHIFTEKPMAVDAPGLRSVIETAARAEEKKLCLVAGFCWRYSSPERATYQKLHEGAIGTIVSMHATYHSGPLGTHPRQPEWSDMEWQLRNWQHFTWLSGDHLVEQAVHSVDKINWAMNNRAPLRATALGGRGVRQGPESGNVYDHFTVIYEYPDDVRCYLTARQQPNCTFDNADYITGTDGFCHVNGWAPTHEIRGAHPWHYPTDAPHPNMYQVEHDELFAAIRSGKPINDGPRMARSTMLAILGRMSAYTGQTISWDDALASREDLSPPAYEFGDLATPGIARPGETKFF